MSEDGYLEKEIDELTTDTEIIYLEFFLDIPENWEIALEYKWFYEDELVQIGSGNHSEGYTIAALDRDPNIMQEFPVGKYRVEIWFLNTKIGSEVFYVK